jgi:SOS-response transcriptional repressor LexA
METLGTKLLRARKASHLSLEQLAETLGWSPSRISLYERDIRVPRLNVLRELADALGCPFDQLIAENALLNVAHVQMTPRAKVPLISWVRAGSCHPAADPYEPGDAEEWIETEIKVNKNSYALTVRGDSMEPLFPEGCVIVVDSDKRAENGSFVIARLDDSGDVTFKQLVKDAGMMYLKPLNERYPIIPITRDATICGVIVEMIQRRRFAP